MTDVAEIIFISIFTGIGITIGTVIGRLIVKSCGGYAKKQWDNFRKVVRSMLGGFIDDGSG